METATLHMQKSSSSACFLAETDPRPLQEILGLMSGLTCNIVLVAIDIENITNLKRGLPTDSFCEVGLTTLDIKNIDGELSNEPISSHNFTSGPSGYQERAVRRFEFWKLVAVTQDEMIEIIRMLLPRDRQIIFVGHDIQNEL